MDYSNSIFHKNLQRINGGKDNHSFIGSAKIHKYILLIAAPHMEGFIIEAADQELFVLDTKTLFCKIS